MTKVFQLKIKIRNEKPPIRRRIKRNYSINYIHNQYIKDHVYCYKNT